MSPVHSESDRLILRIFRIQTEIENSKDPKEQNVLLKIERELIRELYRITIARLIKQHGIEPKT